MTSNTETVLIVFVALTGVAVLLQACVLLAIYISLRKAAKSTMEVTQDLKATVLPMVHSTRALVERVTPEIISISAGVAELTEMLKRETRGVSFSAAEIMQRVSLQSKRMDAMLTNGLNLVERAGEVVESAVAAPVRQVNGIVAAFHAIVDTYRSFPPRRKPVQSDADNDPGI
jgi:hypothetical protein